MSKFQNNKQNSQDVVKEKLEDIEKFTAELETKINAPETEQTIKKFFDFYSKFYNYSMYNTMFLFIQSMNRKANVERFASFKSWTNIKNEDGENVQVKKGSKGFTVLVPLIGKVYQKDENGKFIYDENGGKIPELNENGNEKEYLSFKIGYVFDVNQTNCKEIGAWNSLEYRSSAVVNQELVFDLANKIQKTYNVPVNFINDSNVQSGGCYHRINQTITINTAVATTAAHQLGTLFHELGHHLLKDENRSVAEGKAEAFSYCALKSFGITQKSELYIKNWIYKKDIKLIDILKDITETVKTSLNKLNIQELILEQQENNKMSM